MKLVVIIPTYGRRDLLSKTLEHLEAQARSPDKVVISAPNSYHVEQYHPKNFELSYVYGLTGACAQRNAAIEHVIDQYDILTCFDDDFLPSTSYLWRVEQGFEANPDWVVIRGEAVHDGATGPGFSFDEGLDLLAQADMSDPAKASAGPVVDDHIGAYGCNMSFRADVIGDLRFDERLPLYGWQEDIDFTSQLRARGRVVGMNTLYGVHLGIKAGRVSGIRFGYSQVVNPVYLVRKGTVPRDFAYKLMLRNIAANVLKSVSPEAYVDRRGRLKGNL